MSWRGKTSLRREIPPGTTHAFFRRDAVTRGAAATFDLLAHHHPPPLAAVNVARFLAKHFRADDMARKIEQLLRPRRDCGPMPQREMWKLELDGLIHALLSLGNFTRLQDLRHPQGNAS